MGGRFEGFDPPEAPPEPRRPPLRPVVIAAVTLIWLNIVIGLGLILTGHGGGEQGIWIAAWVVALLGLHSGARWAPAVGLLVAGAEYIWGLVTAGEFLSTTLVIGVLLLIAAYRSEIGSPAGR